MVGRLMLMEWSKVLQAHPCGVCEATAKWLYDGNWLCQEHYEESTQALGDRNSSG